MNHPGMSAFRNAILPLIFLFASVHAIAHPAHESHQPESAKLAQGETPAPTDADADMVSIDGLTGPRNTRGISSIEELGVIDLGLEFSAMQGRQMRARIFTIAPGGVIAVHAHEQRPGYALILSGSIIEYRNDASGALVRNAGDIAIEKGGVAHWWENVSAEPVRALVVDIFMPEKAAPAIVQ